MKITLAALLGAVTAKGLIQCNMLSEFPCAKGTVCAVSYKDTWINYYDNMYIKPN